MRTRTLFKQGSIKRFVKHKQPRTRKRFNVQEIGQVAARRCSHRFLAVKNFIDPDQTGIVAATGPRSFVPAFDFAPAEAYHHVQSLIHRAKLIYPGLRGNRIRAGDCSWETFQ